MLEPIPDGIPRNSRWGKPGASSLAIMQKIASPPAHRKAQSRISISPELFFHEKVNQIITRGISAHCRRRSLRSARILGAELKRDAARRMIGYPRRLRGTGPGIRTPAARGRYDPRSALYAAMWPLGKMANAVARAQDHVEAGLNIANISREKCEAHRMLS